MDFSSIGSVPTALIRPNGGEKWRYGTSQTVQWNTSLINGSTVDMYVLYDDPSDLKNYSSSSTSLLNNKNWYKFAGNVNNTGSYSIDPKNLNGSGDAYVVLIIGSQKGWDVSNTTFELGE